MSGRRPKRDSTGKFSAKFTLTGSPDPTSSGATRKKMPPKKAKTPRIGLKRKRPCVAANERQEVSASSPRISKTPAIARGRPGVLRRPVTYELSDEEEDSTFNTKPISSGRLRFYDLLHVTDTDTETETSAPPVDRDDSVTELPSVQGRPEQREEASAVFAPSVNLEAANLPLCKISSAQGNNTLENLDSIIDRFLTSDYASRHDDCKKSCEEILADVDKLLNSSISTAGCSSATDKPPSRCETTTTRHSPNAPPVIEVIDLSSPPVYSRPVIIDISDSPRDTREKPAGSVEPNRSSKPNLGDCPVCLEPIGSRAVAATTCGHIFCDPCIRNCVKSVKKCPICRKALSLRQIHPLFISNDAAAL